MSGFKFSFIPAETEAAATSLDESQELNKKISSSGRTTMETKTSSNTPCKNSNIVQNNNTNDKQLSTPRLKTINISATMSTMKSSPQTWNTDRIELSPSKRNENHHTPTSLKRIAINEKPFESNPKEMGMNQHSLDTNQNRLNAEKTDLIPGYYEGGLKVWECSIDLCNHLLDLIVEHQPQGYGEKVQNDLSAALGARGSTLELGCGHALPGCTVLRELFRLRVQSDLMSRCECEDSDVPVDLETDDAVHVKAKDRDNSGPIVVFTDYNHFVLKDVTLPNIVLNCTGQDQDNAGSTYQYKKSTGLPLHQFCSLVAGDWLELSRELKEGTLTSPNTSTNIPKEGKFDLILAAETTYTPSSANDTAYLLMNHLKPGAGVGFIATKRYYFGVGGGSDAFRDAIATQTMSVDGVTYCLIVELVKEYNDGKSNIRDLWRVKCIQK
jgi:hypothetical protein